MEEELKLRARIKPMETHNSDEIEHVRDIMGRLGEYDGRPTDHYEGSQMDLPLQQSIERFQKENGLEVDGTIYPGGETEGAINGALRKAKEVVSEKKKAVSDFMFGSYPLEKKPEPIRGEYFYDGKEYRYRPDKRNKEHSIKAEETIYPDGKRNEIRPAWNVLENFLITKREYDRVKPLGMNDRKKHRYVACVGGQGGWPMYLGINLLGDFKESYDFARKTISKNARREGGGISGIYKDSEKDMDNNTKGSIDGLIYRDGDCDAMSDVEEGVVRGLSKAKK